MSIDLIKAEKEIGGAETLLDIALARGRDEAHDLTPQLPCNRPRPKEKRMRSPVRPRFLDWSGCRGRDLTTRVRSARRTQRCHVSRCHDPGP